MKRYSQYREQTTTMPMHNPNLVARTWWIECQQSKDLAELATSLNVNHSELMRHLIRFALAEIAAGRIAVHVRPSRHEIVGMIGEIEE